MITLIICSTFIFLTIWTSKNPIGVKVTLKSDTNTSMNTSFKDNTEVPVFQPMTDDEAKKDAKKFESFATDVVTGVNEILREDKK